MKRAPGHTIAIGSGVNWVYVLLTALFAALIAALAETVVVIRKEDNNELFQ
jgi:hypothetical protein